MLKDGKVYDSSNIDNIFDNIGVDVLSAERAQEESERKSRLIKASREKARRDKKAAIVTCMDIIKRDGDWLHFQIDKKATIFKSLSIRKLAGNPPINR